jgi:tRNA U34 5-methylaminomethyl-2-thiouridine-forming methyltransferase MnmC
MVFQMSNERILSVDYHGFESFPLAEETLKDFSEKFPLELRTFHRKLITLPPGEQHHSESNFSFSWNKNLWPSVRILDGLDVFFYDAFSPDKQPELWTTDAFGIAHEAMNPRGMLVTYCAKGYVRRNMESAGFITVRLPGPPGKCEMLRAVKPDQICIPITQMSST